MDENLSSRGAPWDWQPSLEAMCEEIHVDFNQLIEGFKENKDDDQIGQKLGVSAKTITSLRNHFERYGIDSMMGQD